MRRLRPAFLVALAFTMVAASNAFAAPVIQITGPLDEANVNLTGGPPDLVDVTYQVTGNICTGVKSTYGIVPYVNGVPVLCSGAGCSCDGTSESCNNVTKTITLDGNAFNSCLNTIQLEMSPRPFCGPSPAQCFSPCSSAIFSNTIQVWQSNYKECTGCGDCNKSFVGRPVDVATGRMYHEMTDLRIAGPLPIEFTRRYDSQSTFNGAMGFGWQHAYQMRIEPAGTNREVFVDRAGRRIYFAKNRQGAWDENRIEHLVLSAPGSPAWRVTDKHQTRWDFDASGRLIQISDRTFNGTIGNKITLTYTGSNLTAITDAVGRVVNVTYYGTTPDRIETISAGGRTVTYTYDPGTGNLTRVDFPDSSFVTYEYNDPNETPPRHNLTAAYDSATPTPHLIEGHTYNADDTIATTQSDAGNYAYTLEYNTPAAGQTRVTNSRGFQTTYTLDGFSGLVKQSNGPGCTSCGGGVITTLAYDNFLNVTDITDGRNVLTHMTYDGQGNVLTRTEGSGTRMWTFTYDTTFGFLKTVTIPSVGSGACLSAHPNKVVTNTYRTTPSANGDLMEQKIEGCQGPNLSDFFTNITGYDYDTHGQLAMVNGPRTVAPDDVTTYAYYPDGDADVNKRARLQRVTNAMGHETNYASHDGGRPPYDLYGNIKSVIDPNDVETQYEYDGKDRVTSVTLVDDAITTENRYDPVGNLYRVRLPNCVETGLSCAFSLEYVYDTVNRLKEIHDAVGNKIVYTYDTEGNRTREEYQDAGAVPQRFTNFEYDSFNRLERVCHGAPTPGTCGPVFTQYTYYDDGTRHTEQDPEGHVTTFDYDTLKRLSTVTQTVGVSSLLTTYGYDGQDNMASVKDPRSLQTTYTNSDLGWRLSTTSPDTGLTSYAYDPAGNLTAITNANAVTVNRTYDSVNRLLTVTYPTPSLNVTYSYDAPDSPAGTFFNVGRRTGMTDPSGTSAYHYNRRGLLKKEDKAIGFRTYTTQYDYDKNGNLTQILYPTESPLLRQGEADYQYDDADRVSLVRTKVNGGTTIVADTFSYKPFGPRTEMRFGNLLSDARSYGSRYQLGTWTLGGLLSYTHVFNNDLNLTSRTDNLNAANNRTFGYDEAHRLTQASAPGLWGNGVGCTGGVTYTYDLNGNRQCKGEATPVTATNYTYTPSTNRLASSTGGEAATYSSDNNGNITGDGTHTYQYSQADRLATVDSGPTATYTYDGDGRRVIKTSGIITTNYLYDPNGRLLTEVVPGSATTGEDYLYLRGDPLARVDWIVTEADLTGNPGPLLVSKGPPNAHLDWTNATGSGSYVVRRKQVVSQSDKTFNGSIVIAGVADPTRTYDDPVLSDANRYDYKVLRKTSNDALLFYHTDHLGTPIAMTDGIGALAWRVEQRPFGDGTPVGTVVNNLRFPGQYLDGETGLHYNLFRDYQSRLGRYWEPDPLGLAAGLNLWGYAEGNPIVVLDLSGLDALDVQSVVAKVAKNNNCVNASDELIVCIAWKESGFDPAARNPKSSATGLLQITRNAAQDAGASHDEMTDPDKNIAAASKYLCLRIRWAKGDVKKGLEGYGTGPGYADDLLECESCLKKLPGACGHKDCLDRIHR
ncbi:MAG: DUF6531 domain-containing protein [Acidobacteriia bacterium]|nr:DUF6531 domain-containing protein [Terriglobia bacterium]